MMRYRLSLGPGRSVQVDLPSDDPDGFAALKVTGHPLDVETVEELLYASVGIDGRFIEARTTPVDLDVAMKGPYLIGCEPVRLDGDEVLARYVRKEVR